MASVGIGRRATKRNLSRRADLQGMRAIAVLTVFANHLFNWPPGGFVGVDIFFVLSGFFITGLLIRERIDTGELSFRNFYLRRAKRILPSALLVLAVTVIGSYLLLPAVRSKQTLLDALYAAVFAANWRFEWVGADYFQASQPPSPVQHYWSLSIEEQFYFAWPALIVVIFALTRRWRQRVGHKVGRVGLLGAMAAIVAVSFGWAMFQAVHDPNAAYFSTVTRVWELGVGALVAIAVPWFAQIPSIVRPWLAYLGLAGVVASLFAINTSMHWPAPWAVLPVVSTALVVISFCQSEVQGVPMLTNPIARWFGDTSYTLYLWHWPVIILLSAVIPRGPEFYVLALVLSLGLTATTYHFYENPIRQSRWLLRSNTGKRQFLTPQAWGVAGLVAVTVAVSTIASISYNDKLAAASRLPGADNMPTSVPPQSAAPCFGAVAMVNSGCPILNPSVPVQPSIDMFSSDSPEGVFSKCWMNKGEQSDNFQSCDYGYNKPDATRIAIVGDSHAASFLPALWPVLNANKWRLTTYLGWNCQLADPIEGQCETAIENLRADLLSKGYSLVIVTGSRDGVGDAASYAKAWASLVAAGTRIAVVLDNAWPSEDSLACVTRAGNGGPMGDCATPRAQAFARPDPLVAAAELVPGVSVIDLTRFYCNSDSCPSVIGNVFVYRDTDGHLTATYAQTLSDVVAGEIKHALER